MSEEEDKLLKKIEKTKQMLKEYMECMECTVRFCGHNITAIIDGNYTIRGVKSLLENILQEQREKLCELRGE